MTPGIPDEYFIRGNVPMTKQEIRALSISKLRLKKDSIIWDIGAGTGSVSIEAALISREGVVYSIERSEEAAELIKANAEKFNAGNINVVLGEAPDAILKLPQPDRIFIGGTGESTQQIFNAATKKIKDDGIIIINSITLDTAYVAENHFKRFGFYVETICVNISVSQSAGDKTMMIARNPVYIITAKSEG